MKLLLFYTAYLQTHSVSLLSSFPRGTGEQEAQAIESHVNDTEHATTPPYSPV